MKISYNWLKTFIQPDLSLEELCEQLTMSGLEVEHVEAIESIKGGLQGLIVGEVTQSEKHPNADRLTVNKVKVSSDTELDIVCGAPNIAAGQKVVVAPVGTTLFPTEGQPFEIKKAKIRGERSEGMICAEDEIGLGTVHDGIMVLDSSAKVGTSLRSLYKIESDQQIEIAIIPNRGDAVSHLGVARELQALTGTRYRKPGTVSFDDRGPMRVEIEIHDMEACPRYSGISLSNVKVGPSPDWLQKRLLSIGLKPINNVVDITNFIQHDIGQPIHAFDLDRIESKEIHIRKAKANETITTLDGEERKLQDFNLLICDAKKPLAIAGVLGGLDSGVTEKTKNIFIESAYFDPTSIRKTAKHFGLNTDASYRYERGTDPNITEYALRRVVNLIQEHCGAELASELTDIYPHPIADKEISINLIALNQFTGHEIPKDEVLAILQNLEIKIAANNGDNLLLHVPPYRPDVDRPVDIYEEILRIYGFDSIPIPSKVNYVPSIISNQAPNKIQQRISNYLVAQGFLEIMSNSLVSSENYSKNQLEESIPMLNPLSKEMDILRMNLIDSALDAVSYNVNRKNADLKFFEFGKTYRKIKGQFIEQQVLLLTATGRLQQEHWNSSKASINIHHMRGLAENVLRKLNIPAKQFSKLIKDIEVSPAHLKKHQIKQDVVAVEINWDRCLQLTNSKIQLKEIPKFPVVRRDLSLLVDRAVSYKEIRNIAKQGSSNLLKEVVLFDVYMGKPLAENEVSYSIALYLSDAKKTMEDAEIDHIMDKLIGTYESKINAKIRR